MASNDNLEDGLILINFIHAKECFWDQYGCKTSNAVRFGNPNKMDKTTVFMIIHEAVRDHVNVYHGEEAIFTLTRAIFNWDNGSKGCNLLEITEERQRDQVQLAIYRGQACTLDVTFETH